MLRICLVIMCALLIVPLSLAKEAETEVDWRALKAEANKSFLEGKYKEIVVKGQRALAAAIKECGPKHAAVAAVHNNLAMFHEGREEYLQALHHARQSYFVAQKALGDNHKHVGVVLITLASVELAMGHLQEALVACDKSYKILQHHFKGSKQLAARLLEVMARARTIQYKFDEAERLARRAVKFREDARYNRTMLLSQARNTLAAILLNKGRFQEAEKICFDVMSSQERDLGEHHPELIYTLSVMAAICSLLERTEDVESLHKRTVTIIKKALEKKNPNYVANIDKLCEARSLKAAIKSLKDLLKEARKMAIPLVGTEHPVMAELHSSDAFVFYIEAKLKEALASLDKAMAILAKS